MRSAKNRCEGCNLKCDFRDEPQKLTWKHIIVSAIIASLFLMAIAHKIAKDYGYYDADKNKTILKNEK